jgi:hypothetical protein
MKRRLWIELVVLGLALSGCIDSGESVQIMEPEFEVAKTTQPLQEGNGYGVYLVDRDVVTNIKHSVAALRLTKPPEMPHGSCGMTWVSAHYGVTAQHCLGTLAHNQRNLTVEEITVDKLNASQLNEYMNVYLWWPFFVNGATLTTGYSTQRYTCSIVRRCSSEPTWGGRNNCGMNDDVDIALVHCPDRTKRNHAWTTETLFPYGIPADIDDLVTLDVNTWWFHEVYRMPTFDDGSDRWRNYGLYDRDRLNENWHYTRAHQLLPLLSYAHPGGTPFRTVPSNVDTLNETDTPYCHGTSGSGVFLSGANVLLGPAIGIGVHSQIGGKLCEPATNAGPGRSVSSYVRAVLTARFMTTSPEVNTDRGQFPQ